MTCRWQKLEEAEDGFSPGDTRRNQPCDTDCGPAKLILDYWPAGVYENKFMQLEVTKFVVIGYSFNVKLIFRANK